MCLPKNLLKFGRPKTAFSPREMSQRLGTSEGLKIGWWCHVTSADLLSLHVQYYSGHCVVFWQGFVELTDVFDFKKGIAKQMKFYMIGELSITTILHICRYLVNYATFLQIILHHTCWIWLCDRADIFGQKFCVLKMKKIVLQAFWQV